MACHNGQIARFQEIKRELVVAIDPSLYPLITGSSDTETFFFLALTFGLEDDPPAAVQRAVGFVEKVCEAHGIREAMRMSVAVSDGTEVWAFRYSTEGIPPSLYFSTKAEQYHEVASFQSLSDETRLVVSGPLGSREGEWNEFPPSHYGLICRGEDHLLPFESRAA